MNTYDYDVFGALRAQTGSQDNDFTFAGEQVDEGTGLQYLRARYYNVDGRFISKDKFPSSLMEPSSLNQYAYVLANLVNYIDPTGEHCQPWHPHHCIEGVVEVGLDLTFGLRAPITRRLEAILVAGSTGDVRYVGGVRIIESCSGAVGGTLLGLFGAGAFTLGHTVCSAGPLEGRLREHEMRHVRQYDLLGDAFLPFYFGPANLAAVVECVAGGDISSRCIHDANILERLAGPD